MAKKKIKLASGAKTPRGVLNHAARLIRQVGWTRHKYIEWVDEGGVPMNGSYVGAFCALGAIYTAADGRYDSFDPIGVAAENILSTQLVEDGLGAPPFSAPVPNWNDHYAQSGEEVAQALERAARRPEARTAVRT
jgi:hypothetical protein